MKHEDSSKINQSMWKAKVSDYADMCHTHLSRVVSKLNMLYLFHVSETFYALDLTMEADQIRVEDRTFQKRTVNN